MASTLTLVAAVILFIQGVSILIQSGLQPHIRRFGVLTVSLAMTGIVGHVLFTSGALVLSPEFGVIMVQGPLARIGLGVLIFAFALQLGFGWSIARLAAEWPSRLPWLMIIGGAIGLFSVFRLFPLNPQEQWEAFQIFAYDLWLPPLLIWFCICFVESSFALFRSKNGLLHATAIAVLIASFSVWALRQSEQLHDQLSEILWTFWSYMIFPLAAVLATLFLYQQLKVRLPRTGKWLQALSLLVFGGLSLYRWYSFGDSQEVSLLERMLSSLFPFATSTAMERITYSLMPFLLWLGWLLLMLGVIKARSLFVAFRRRAAKRKFSAEDIFHLKLFLTLMVIAASLVGVFYEVLTIPQNISLLTFFIAWAVLTELVTDGVLHDLYLLLRQRPASKFDTRIGKNIRRISLALWKKLIVPFATKLAAALNWLILVGKDVSIAAVLVRILLISVIVLALNEVPNYGKTVIQPFSDAGMPGRYRLGVAISDRVVRNISLLNQELRPFIMTPSGKNKPLQAPLGNHFGNSEVALALNTDVEIGGVKIPLSMIFEPVQRLMRFVLNVRLVSGSIHKDSVGCYIVFLNSSYDEVWNAQFSTNPRSTTARDSLIAIAELADEIAFKIISSDSNLFAAGMTKSWEAFQFFQAGLNTMAQFKEGDYDARTTAIAEFQRAVRLDPGFVMARYRLGLTLLEDGQPAAAQGAFKACLAVNPNFVPASIALASLLYNYESFNVSTAAIAAPPSSSNPQREYRSEARERWRKVILLPQNLAYPPDLALAYAGLCREAYGSSGATLEAYKVAHFFGQRALKVYLNLPASLRATPEIKSARVSVLNALGVALMRSKDSYEEIQWTAWHCDGYMIVDDSLGTYGMITHRKIQKSPFAKEALGYFQHALALNPYEPVIRGNAASTTFSLGDTLAMKELQTEVSARLRLAQTYQSIAKVKSFARNHLAPIYYRLALAEYDSVLAREPNNLTALNNSAYTFWEWRLHWSKDDVAVEPDFELALKAEKYARKAVELSTDDKPSNRAIYLSTLGEVLLGHGRFFEAVEVLQTANALAPQHPAFNEIRSDLAQAYFCFIGKHLTWEGEPCCITAENVHMLIDSANALWEKIGESEKKREFQPFKNLKEKLLKITMRIPLMESMLASSETRYELNEYGVRYRHNPLTSNSLGVSGMVFTGDGKEANEELVLHVWGGGVDERIWVGNGITNQIVLAAKPRDTHEYYYAQLEECMDCFSGSYSFKPLSKAHSFRTYENSEMNFVQLFFTEK